MRKLFTLILLSAVCLLSHAALTDIESMPNVPYLKSTALQPGTTADITICIKSERSIGSIKGTFVFPAGITVNSVKGVGDENLNELTNVFLFGGCGGHSEIATVNVTVSPDMELGEYEMTIDDYQMVEEDNYNQDYKGSTTTKLIIQRAAVVEEQGEDCIFMVRPFTATSGDTTIPVQLKNNLDVANFKLVVEYPDGIAAKTGRGVSVIVNKDNLYSSEDVSTTALSISQAYDASTRIATYTVSNTATDTYMASDDFFAAFELPITVANDAAGVYNVKVTVSDITAYDTDVDPDCTSPISIPGGEYMFSVFVGQSTSDAILYGIYDDAAKAAAMAALKGGSADITQTNLDDSFAPNDVLVYGPTATTYRREVKAGWGTICLPFAVQADEDIIYYTLSSATNESITLTKVDGLAANEPGFFKANAGVRAMQADGYVWAKAAGEKDAIAGLTLTGCYAQTNLASGAGYYISGGKLYGDGANVKPFRAYLAGSVAGGAKALTIYASDETGLHDITSQFTQEEIYNLQGMKHQQMQHGINIIGGKKVLVK